MGSSEEGCRGRGGPGFAGLSPPRRAPPRPGRLRRRHRRREVLQHQVPVQVRGRAGLGGRKGRTADCRGTHLPTIPLASPPDPSPTPQWAGPRRHGAGGHCARAQDARRRPARGGGQAPGPRVQGAACRVFCVVRPPASLPRRRARRPRSPPLSPPPARMQTENLELLKAGCCNLARHIANARCGGRRDWGRLGRTWLMLLPPCTAHMRATAQALGRASPHPAALASSLST